MNRDVATVLALFSLALAAIVSPGCGESDPRGGLPATPTASSPVAPADLAQGSDVAAWIEVRVTDADGSPAKGAGAYAVRVGRRSPADTRTPDWPSAGAGDDGVARIPLPGAGLYDVGVEYGEAEQPRGFVEDVRVEAGSTARVAVRLPALARVEVVAEGIDLAHAFLYAVEARAPGERYSYSPARGERKNHRWSQSMAREVRLPEGVPYEVWLSFQDPKTGDWVGSEWKPDLDVVRAPARVTFRRDARPAPRPWIEVPLRFLVTRAVPAGLGRSELRVWYAEGTPGAMELGRTLDWKDGKPEETSLRVLLGAKPEKLTWSGDGVAAGERLLPGAAEAKEPVAPIEIAIRADDLPFVEGVDVVGGPKPLRTDSPWLHARGPDWESDEEVDYQTEYDDESWRLRPGWKAIVEWGAWWVSRPVTVPKRGRLTFDLVPGGYLLATSSRVVTPGLGRLSIRRADGAWLGERRASDIENDDCDGDSVGTAYPGMILGPFPEGDVELVVSLGGEERVRIVGHVKANRITPFPLTW